MVLLRRKTTKPNSMYDPEGTRKVRDCQWKKVDIIQPRSMHKQ